MLFQSRTHSSCATYRFSRATGSRDYQGPLKKKAF